MHGRPWLGLQNFRTKNIRCVTKQARVRLLSQWTTHLASFGTNKRYVPVKWGATRRVVARWRRRGELKGVASSVGWYDTRTTMYMHGLWVSSDFVHGSILCYMVLSICNEDFPSHLRHDLSTTPFRHPRWPSPFSATGRAGVSQPDDTYYGCQCLPPAQLCFLHDSHTVRLSHWPRTAAEASGAVAVPLSQYDDDGGRNTPDGDVWGFLRQSRPWHQRMLVHWCQLRHGQW